MMTNHKTVTLFCCKTIGRGKVWLRTVLSGVNFHETDQLIVGDKNATSSDEVIIRIPAPLLQNYVDPYTWKGLTEEDALNYFTLKKGDYIVKGEVEDEVSSSAEILERYEAFEVIKVVDNLSASPYSAHMKLVVK